MLLTCCMSMMSKVVVAIDVDVEYASSVAYFCSASSKMTQCQNDKSKCVQTCRWNLAAQSNGEVDVDH